MKHGKEEEQGKSREEGEEEADAKRMESKGVDMLGGVVRTLPSSTTCLLVCLPLSTLLLPDLQMPESYKVLYEMFKVISIM